MRKIGVTEPTINTPLDLSPHPNRNHENEPFWFEEHRNSVRWYDTTQRWECTKSQTKWGRPKVDDRGCIFIVRYDEMKMRWCQSTLPSSKYILTVTLSVSITAGSLHTHRHSLTVYYVAIRKYISRCTWRLRSSDLKGALGGRVRARLHMHLEADIKWNQRYTLKL